MCSVCVIVQLAVAVGEDAFANWIYEVKVRAVGGPPESQYAVNTSALSVLLENLQPETLYEVLLSAYGPGGRQLTEDKLVFSTKSAGKLCSTSNICMQLYTTYRFGRLSTFSCDRNWCYQCQNQWEFCCHNWWIIINRI